LKNKSNDHGRQKALQEVSHGHSFATNSSAASVDK
jgi:hypothetical protein